MKKVLLAVGTAAGFGLGCTYAALYHNAMHPKCPKPEPGKRHIACVGDSITYGYGLMGAFRRKAYPAVLQEMLGNEYQVMNFGICDRTLQDQADKPYRREKIYAASLNSEPEAVIIMLGTNDAKPHNWNPESYERDLRSYVAVYQGLSSKPRVILMQPPRAFSIAGKTLDSILNSAIKTEMHESIAKIGQETGCNVIDIYALTENHREWFADGLHLNGLGTRAIAQQLVPVLT